MCFSNTPLQSNGEPAPKPVLSHKTPDQILSTPIRTDHYFFVNGLWGRGMPLGIIGPPGCGKSRIVTQLMASSVINTSFMGIECKWPPLKFLVLQAENSTARLQSEMTSLKQTLTDEQWRNFNARVTYHTIETHLDTALSIDDFWNRSNIAELITQVTPDVVVFDPLEAFASRSLNTDAVMRKTVQDLIKMAQRTKPTAATLFVHHSLIGATAITRATGFERGAYGKGSKSFTGIMRGLINVVPQDPEDNSKLVLACGKNSNGREFKPTGINLNADTMRYDVDTDFDFAAWKESFKKSPKSKAMISADQVAELVRVLPMKKKDLVAALMDETGCQKTTAYASIDKAIDISITLNASREYVPIQSEPITRKPEYGSAEELSDPLEELGTRKTESVGSRPNAADSKSQVASESAPPVPLDFQLTEGVWATSSPDSPSSSS